MVLAASWHAAATVLAHHRDVLDARPVDGEAPAALVRRGWAPYLGALDDAAVDGVEGRGLDAPWPEGAPDSLLAFAASVRQACDVASMETYPAPSRAARRFERPRKYAQIEAFARVVVPIAANANRVMDIGSGHGHLTRELAGRLGVPVIGLEHDANLAGRARALSASGTASFAVTDVLRDGLGLTVGDCVVGLHACGELGDAMVESAARVGASLALVGCCLQKQRSVSRAPLWTGGERGATDVPDDWREALDLPKAVLGLSNLTARDAGVEASRADNVRARERRLALHRLLTEASFEVRHGVELEGLNRRAAHAELGVLVSRAFGIRRRPPPSAAAIADAARWAAEHHARMRRYALPRSLLGRLLEVFVLLDRARYLEAHGFEVSVGVLFPTSVSARNLALVGRPRP